MLGEPLCLAQERRDDDSQSLALPRFSVPGGVYTNRILVEIQPNSPSTTIRYTVDGSEPTELSMKYSRGLEITNSTLLKAKGFAAGQRPGLTISQTFTVLHESLWAFNSNLPLVIINTFGQNISHQDKVAASIRFIKPIGGRTSLLGVADVDGRVEINVRGNTSRQFPKSSFTLKLKNDQGQPLKVPLLGLPAESDWVLYAPYFDRTLIRDVLAYDLSNQIGRYAPRTRFVEVFAAGAKGELMDRDYLGLYVLEEKIKPGKYRVDIDEMGIGEDASSGGYIFKKDHVDPTETGFRTERGIHFLYVYPKEGEISEEQKSWLGNYLNQFERVLYGRRFAAPTNGYSRYLDVDAFIDHYWLVEMSKNVDGFRFSTFLHLNQSGKLKMGPIWDWDQSFGNANFYDGASSEGWYWPYIRETEIRWFARLMQDADFQQRYVDRWAELRNGPFATSNILARMDELTASFDEAQKRNSQRWPTRQSYEEYIRKMKQWIRGRIAWIDQQFLPAPGFSLQESASIPGGVLIMQAPKGEIYYTTDGTDPRQPGGAISSASHRYQSPLACNEPMQVFARAYLPNNWGSPTKTALPLPR